MMCMRTVAADELDTHSLIEPGTGQFHKFVRNPSRVSIYANAFEVTSQRK